MATPITKWLSSDRREWDTEEEADKHDLRNHWLQRIAIEIEEDSHYLAEAILNWIEANIEDLRRYFHA